MSAPGVSAFGDGSHSAGESGLTVDGGNFGAFAGSVWIYANSDLTGAADQLTVTAWNDLQITVTIPGSLTNTSGTRYLFVQREDLAWSNGFAFSLTAGGSSVALTGSAITSAAGSVGNLHSLPVSGQAGTLAQGSVAQDHSLALAGSAATVAQGSVSVPGNVTVALTGIQATFAADALVPAIACAASGSAVAATAGSLAPEWAVALSGAQIVAASGIVLREGDVTVLIDGQQITAIAGTVVVGAQVGYLDATVIVLPDARIHSRCSGIFVGNDSILALQDLVDRNENAIANAAVSLVEFQDDDGDEPAGLSLPLSLLPSAQGLNTYEARLPHTLDLAVGTLYRAKVRAAAGSLVGEWVEPVLAKRRVA